MIKRDLCKGCGACQAICPNSALAMEKNFKGFNIPVIDKSKCIQCNLCHKICNWASDELFNDDTNQIAYAARSRNVNISSKSRSGGIFYQLALHIIEDDKGVVYGAALEGASVKHARVTNIKDLECLAGSKYVWSDHVECILKVEADLKAGKKVLFSGLPCQIASIKSYLELKNINHKELILCDIICHSIPSPKLYENYLQYQERRYRIRIKTINFRNKEDFGWRAHIETLYADKKVIHTDLWTKLFHSHYCVSNSCFYCGYKKTERVGDISLGDCWNIEKTKSPLNDDRGTSLLLVNNQIGSTAIKSIAKDLELEIIDLKDFMQPALQHAIEKPVSYDIFWKDYVNKGFEYVIRNHVRYNFKKKLKLKAKLIYYSMKKKIDLRKQ